MYLDNDKGLSGLVNIGNSCYINSVIQSLSNTTDLTQYFLNDSYLEHLKNKSIEYKFTHQWVRLLNGLWEENCTVSPNSFLKSLIFICKEKKLDLTFSGFQQNDFQEFLVFFLDTLHKSLNYNIQVEIKGSIKTDIDKIAYEAAKSWKSFFKNDYSIIVELFYGQFTTEIKDIDKKKISINYQPFSFLLLPVPKKNEISIQECLDLYFKEELLINNNFKDDNDIIYKDIIKQTKIWEFPKILIICLNRFDNQNIKINTNVLFEKKLNLRKYSVLNKKVQYKLYSICNHYGITSGGHYTCICCKNDIWYEFNDSKVVKIEEKNVFTKNAYCLFYEIV